MEPEIPLSVSFPRDEQRIFNVLSEIHWRIGPYIALRKEIHFGWTVVSVSVVIRISSHPILSLIVWSPFGI